jgi:hypothetical protein
MCAREVDDNTVNGRNNAMSGYTWDGMDDGSQNQDPQPRDLRKMIEDLGKKLGERDAVIASLQGKVRQTEASKLFADAGLPAMAAELFPVGQDPTEENVKAFAEKYGSLFGKPAGGATGAPTDKNETQPTGQQSQTSNTAPAGSDIDAQVAAFAESLRRVTTAEAGVTPTNDAALAQQTLLAANASATDLASFIAALQTGAAPVRE